VSTGIAGASYLSWLKLVHTLADAGDGFESLAEVAGHRVGCGDDVLAGLLSHLDLNGG
jgi:hypothetical protein